MDASEHPEPPSHVAMSVVQSELLELIAEGSR
jgi:hypothetical protein